MAFERPAYSPTTVVITRTLFVTAFWISSLEGYMALRATFLQKRALNVSIDERSCSMTFYALKFPKSTLIPYRQTYDISKVYKISIRK